MIDNQAPTRRRFIKTSATAGLTLAAVGMRPLKGMTMPQPYKKMMILGVDGFDPALIKKMIGQGKLPTLAKLAQSGTLTKLATANPPQSPVAWSSIATGLNPGGHGIYDFIIRDPKKYLPELSLIRLKPSRFGLGGGSYVNPVHGTPFWEAAAAAGVNSTVIRWPVSFPPDKYKSKALAGLGAPDIKGSLGRYAFYTEKTTPEDEHSRGQVVPTEFKGDAAETKLYGPLAASFGRPKPTTLDLTMIRSGDRLELKGPCNVTLKQGQWSDWQTFTFDLGLTGGKVRGIARFYLTNLKPLQLYLTPIQIDPYAPNFPLSQPEGYAAELAKAVGGPYATLGMPEETKGLSEGRIPDEAFLEMCRSINNERKKMFDFELGRFNDGLFVCVFDTSDRIQHMFYRLAHPDHPLYDKDLAAKFGSAIEDHYVEMDGVIGQALAAADDQTALMIVSDHGFNSYTRSVHLNNWLAEAGYLTLKDHDPKANGELFEFVDWSRTKAYALGFGSIYLNLDDREKNGQVKPGAEADKLAAEISQRLLDFKDPQGGAKVVEKVHAKKDVYSGPLADQAPELVVGYRPPYRVSWTTAIGGVGPALITENEQKWAGDHCIDASFVPGVMAGNFKINNQSPAQAQTAATALKLLGLEPIKGMAPSLV